jgi:epoxyqueuosine reductase
VPNLAAVVAPLLADRSPLVRAMAVWALARLVDRPTVLALREQRLREEQDDAVRAEWARTAA